MNLVLWIAQWALAGFFTLTAVIRFADSLERYRRPAVGSDRPLFSRVQSFEFGLLFLAGSVGLISPAIGLHQNWLVPAAALLLVAVLVDLFVRFGYGDELSWLLGLLLLALAALRAWPFPVAA